MAWYLLLLAFCIQIVAVELAKPTSTEPQQIHLSLGYFHCEVYVTWITFAPNLDSTVRYGTDSDRLDATASGYVTEFVDCGKKELVRYVHRAALKDLEPNTVYTYQCGSEKGGWSRKFSFTTMREGTDWSPRMLVLGDYGYVNREHSFSGLLGEVESKAVDLAFHNGDFAYDMHRYNGKLGDSFMQAIQPIAAQIAYQTSPGNHDYAYNFSHYYQRFTMRDMTNPGGGDRAPTSNFYAFYLGPALIVSISTEVGILQTDIARLTQKNWLRAVLKKANQPENRAQHPWVILFGHRPMYCTSYGMKGTYRLRRYYEDILYENGVDLAIWAHAHTYERMWPVYKRKVYIENRNKPYKNPKAPVHIISGNAGNRQKLDFFSFPPKRYSAFRINQYGYGILHIINSTHLTFTSKVTSGYRAKNGPTAIDSFTLIQEHHGPRKPNW